MSGGGAFRVLLFPRHVDGSEVTLDTGPDDRNLFDNQWNAEPIPGDKTEKGRRLFDWAIEVHLPLRRPLAFAARSLPGANAEDARAAAQYQRLRLLWPQGSGRAGSSSVRSASDPNISRSRMPPLTRMHAVDSRERRAPLTPAERAHLLPLYVQAQTYGNTERDKARIAKARADLAAKFETVTRNATIERDGFTWLMDHGIKTDNVIYYSHTGRFGFGWREPLGPDSVGRPAGGHGHRIPLAL